MMRSPFHWRRIWAGIAAAVIAVSPQAGAQPQLHGLAVGARIRLRAPDAGLLVTTTAILDSVGIDSIYVSHLREPPALRSVARLAVPLSAVTRLESSIGHKSRWAHARRGALWGLGVYALAAGTYIVHERATCHGSECFGEGFAWIGLAGAAPWAAGIGSVVGFSLPVEEWRPVAPGAR